MDQRVEGENSGAYRLFIQLRRSVRLRVGKTGEHHFKRGLYLYCGSAKRNLRQRINRHRRLADEKCGNRHWHIDSLLLAPESRMLAFTAHPGGDECRLRAEAQQIAGEGAVVNGFGATDCTSGCAAHLLYLGPVSQLRRYVSAQQARVWRRWCGPL